MKFPQWLCMAVLSASFVFAQDATNIATSTTSVPRLVRFAGQAVGMSGTVGITFALYKSQTENSALWTETQNVNVGADGRYAVLLGATKAEGVPAELFASGEAQWLGVRVEGKAEGPRVLLVSVPYALKAAEAESLAGRPATDFVTTETLSSAVREQVLQTTGGLAAQTPKASATKQTSTTPTVFSGSNSSAIVEVTQTGTGAALTAASPGTGITATSSATTGTYNAISGTSASTGGRGVLGLATSTSGSSTGVYGVSNATSGFGVYGLNNAVSGSPIGVYAVSVGTSGTAVMARETATSGSAHGLLASVASPNGIAAVLQNTANGKLISAQAGSAHTEVFAVDGAGNITGASLTAATVQGSSNNTIGYGGLFAGADGGGNAVSASGGNANASSGTAGTGIVGNGGTLDAAVTGAFGGDGGDFYGGGGDAGTGNGVSGTGGAVLNSASITAGVGGYFIGGAPSGDGLYAAPSNGGTGNAATLDGNVDVTGTLTTGSATVRIDHPLDPANQYLQYSGVQSSEMLNVYTGNVVLGANGRGVVMLPKWFEAANADFRYQLTAIGAPAVLYISREIREGSFEIAGGTPNMKVSWTVTALRHDGYALAHPAQVEVKKPAAEQGRYLHPEVYGQAQAKGIAAKAHAAHRASGASSVAPGHSN